MFCARGAIPNQNNPRGYFPTVDVQQRIAFAVAVNFETLKPAKP
jgi:hypothetical protein